MMRLDLHVHTRYSADGIVEPRDYLKVAQKNGLNGFAITDHNEIQGAKKAYELAKNYKNLIILHGIEVSSSEGHILGYGVTEKIPRKLTPEETIERITELGGVPVAAHPFRSASGLGSAVIKRIRFNSVEVLNHRSMQRENKRALELAQSIKAGTIGGSDGHMLQELGLAATEFEINSTNEDDILTEITKKRTTPVGDSSTTIEGVKMYTKLLLYWLKRGFKRV